MTTRRDVLAGLAAATTVGASPGYAVQHRAMPKGRTQHFAKLVRASR